MRVSSILRKCPAQRSWPERNILSMLCIFARFRTSVSGILSCILWFSGDILCGSGLVFWGVSGTPSKSHMRRVVSTTALYTLSFVALVMPRRPHTVTVTCIRKLFRLIWMSASVDAFRAKLSANRKSLRLSMCTLVFALRRCRLKTPPYGIWCQCLDHFPRRHLLAKLWTSSRTTLEPEHSLAWHHLWLKRERIGCHHQERGPACTMVMNLGGQPNFSIINDRPNLLRVSKVFVR